MTERNVLAVIPARGGSKGIPRKNLRLLAGKPLVAYTILAAQQAHLVNRVVVSTEDTEIAQVSRQWGAEVVPRPLGLATDEAATDPVLEHVVNHMAAAEGYTPELVVLLQPTSPLRRAGLVDACIERLLDTGADSLLTVFEGHHFFWRRRSGRLEASYDPLRRPRRQDIPEEDQILLENGSVYVTRYTTLVQYRSRLAGKVEWYIMPPEDSLEIDAPIHLQIAEAFLAQQKGKETGRFRNDIRLVVLDFDGVLTDNRVWVTQDGAEAVACCRSDGIGLSMLCRQGVEVMVLSTEVNPVVAARCHKLGLRCKQGLQDKAAALQEEVARRGLDMSQVVYVGNDINDLGCIRLVGFGVAVADAHPQVLAEADLVLSRPGGHGAVRELCDRLIEACYS